MTILESRYLILCCHRNSIGRLPLGGCVPEFGETTTVFIDMVYSKRNLLRIQEGWKLEWRESLYRLERVAPRWNFELQTFTDWYIWSWIWCYGWKYFSFVFAMVKYLFWVFIIIVVSLLYTYMLLLGLFTQIRSVFFLSTNKFSHQRLLLQLTYLMFLVPIQVNHIWHSEYTIRAMSTPQDPFLTSDPRYEHWIL